MTAWAKVSSLIHRPVCWTKANA